MTSLLESLTDAVSDRGPQWVEAAVARARVLADEIEGTPQRAAAVVLADTLEAHRTTLAEGTGGLLAVVVSQVALGRIDAAERAWLEEVANVEEILAAEGAACEALESANSARAKTWATWLEIAQQILRAAGRAAVPLILSCL